MNAFLNTEAAVRHVSEKDAEREIIEAAHSATEVGFWPDLSLPPPNTVARFLAGFFAYLLFILVMVAIGVAFARFS